MANRRPLLDHTLVAACCFMYKDGIKERGAFLHVMSGGGITVFHLTQSHHYVPKDDRVFCADVKVPSDLIQEYAAFPEWLAMHLDQVFKRLFDKWDAQFAEEKVA